MGKLSFFIIFILAYLSILRKIMRTGIEAVTLRFTLVFQSLNCHRLSKNLQDPFTEIYQCLKVWNTMSKVAGLISD